MKERFQVQGMDILDTETGLVWLKDANLFGRVDWAKAQQDMAGMGDGWRLPTVKELLTLIDYEQYDPALPSDHLFTNVQSFYYWSSTTDADFTDYAWYVYMCDGLVSIEDKRIKKHVWPVRDGKMTKE